MIELDKKSYNMVSINSFLNYLRVEELIQKASFDSQIIEIKEEIENDWLKKYSNEYLKDIPFVALAIEFNCKIWTGDKKLINGLEIKGFYDFLK